MRLVDKNGIKIEIGDWLMDCNEDIPYIITKITDNGEVYGEVPVDNIYDKKINLGNVRVVKKGDKYINSKGEFI